MHFFFFIFISYTIQKNEPGNIETIYTSRTGSIYAPLFIGENPEQKIQFRFDIKNNYSYITPPFDEAKLTGTSNEIQINNIKYKTQEYVDRLCLFLDAICQPNHHFQLIDNEDPLKKKVFNSISLSGFAQNSFIHFLKEERIITEETFSILPFDQDLGQLVFGELTGKELFRYKYQCNIDYFKTGDYNWGCGLQRIIIEGFELQFEVKEKMYLTTVDRRIYVPEKFFNLIKKKINKYYKENCNLLVDKVYQTESYFCRCEAVYDFPSISFIIEDYAFVNTVYFLFKDKENGLCEFMIQGKKGEDQTWEFGTNFFMKYKTVFSYDKKTISFYYQIPLKIGNISRNKKIKKIIFFITGVLSFWSMILLIKK